MNALEPQNISCPYCGETIEVLIDCSVTQQQYIEDCQVCCRPINIQVVIDDEDDIAVQAWSEDE